MNGSKTVIVTGATSGIGLAIARTLAAAGMKVFLVGRNPQRLASAARGIPRRSLAGTGLADFSSVAALKGLLATISRRFRRLDALVHAAGEYAWTEIGRADTAVFDALFDINVRAPYLLTQAIVPLLARAKGQVLFVNSSVVKSTGQGAAVFKATQHAVQGFADSLRQDLNMQGIRVTSLYPGRTATPRMRRICAHEGKEYQPKVLLRPRDVASAVLAVLQMPRSTEITDVHLRSVTSY